MSSNEIDQRVSAKASTALYTSKHPVPNIQRYEQRQEQRREQSQVDVDIPERNVETAHVKPQSGLDSLKSFLHINGSTGASEQKRIKEPYYSENRNVQRPNATSSVEAQKQTNTSEGQNEDQEIKDSSQKLSKELDPPEKRKDMKRAKRDHAERNVTDPITHLPITIHDSISAELESVPENLAPAGSEPQKATVSSAASKSTRQLDQEAKEEQDGHQAMRKLFPPPELDAIRRELVSVCHLAFRVGFSVMFLTLLVLLIASHLMNARSIKSQISWLHLFIPSGILFCVGLGLGGCVIWVLQVWLTQRVSDIWDDEIWDTAREQELDGANLPIPESTQWLNSLIASIWPLVNPDLFISLADTLEDVMQASLPKFVRMISVEDLGQGSESLRILGVRWLPTGAAAENVSTDGKPQSTSRTENDREVAGQSNVNNETVSDDDDNTEHVENGQNSREAQSKGVKVSESIAEGMEAEEGDFVNVEVAFAYRASRSGNGLKSRKKNAHLYLIFYLPGGLQLPVWVELRGIIGTMRMRLQICSDPPFVSLCTLTMLGQPATNIACVPLTKRGLNIMDLPIISSFVQNSVDAALSEYVAPKSLTLDLKEILMGDDFKHDTSAQGVVAVRIKRAKAFKEGDGSIGILKMGSSDAYVAVGWGKFGKASWSTRVIIKDMEPVWDETAFLLIGPQEVNAEERLRVQLWDSDRTTADDDLGRIELDLKDLMQNPKSQGRMWDRIDGFMAMDVDENMPGNLEWSVGYFAKTRVQDDEELARQSAEPDIKTLRQLKEDVSRKTEAKLKEASTRDEAFDRELKLQKAQDLRGREDKMIISNSPSEKYPSGIYSIQIHQITGLKFEAARKSRSQDQSDDAEESSSDLPSSYCTVIVNHQKVFQTRTKPKNDKPFFNAGTERFIRDWRTTELMVSVRDARVHEDDPLIGIVYLPLGKLFRERSQVNDNFPLVGGIGYGHVRVSMVFRSVQLQAPKELLGWDYGTLEITGPITSKDLTQHLRDLRLKIRSSIHRGKMTPANRDGQWTGKKDRKIRLAVRKRYSSSIVFEFRTSSLALDKTAAFAVFWPKDIPDNEEQTVTLTVWHGDADLKRAETNCIDEIGERMGHIEVPMKFWRGLSGYHRRHADSPNLKDVFEVLDTAYDNREAKELMADANDSDSENSTGEEAVPNGSQTSNAEDKHNQESGTRGPWDQIEDYKDHSEQLHRSHKGIMQWKGARTAKWVKTKAEHGKDHVLDHFKHHHEREPGIETEA